MSHNKITVASQLPDSNGNISLTLNNLSNVTGTPSDWDGYWTPITVFNDGIKPANSNDQYHGYLIPNLPVTPKNSGDLVYIYWRGVV